MKDRLPEHIEPLRLARSHRLLSGRLPLSRMRRLAESIEDEAGNIDIDLKFDVDMNGVAILEGQVSCSLQLRCQRCMQPMTWPVDVAFKLALVESEAELDALGEQYEPLLLEDDLVSIADIVEDELLLALPIVPRHAEDECQLVNPAAEPVEQAQPAEAEPSPENNPFAVLAELQRKK